MAIMNVSLPDGMKDWVEAQARTGRFESESAYVSDLIRRDQAKAAVVEELQRLVDEGIASGISERSLAEVLAEARRGASAGP
jgi:antitoxin ParD1/3/4